MLYIEAVRRVAFLWLKVSDGPDSSTWLGWASTCHILVINTTEFRWTAAYANALICIASYVTIAMHTTSSTAWQIQLDTETETAYLSIYS